MSLKRVLRKIFSRRTVSSPEHNALPAHIPPVSSIPSSITGQNSPDGAITSRLEQLPFDIRLEILYALDGIDDLSALTHASPTYHRDYLSSRASLLWQCMQSHLGQILVDAYTVNLCHSLCFQRKTARQQIRQFIEAYHVRRSTSDELLSNLPSLEEVVNVAAFYSSTIRPLLHQYTTWARGNLEALSLPDQLSLTERRRVLRGLYRFEIFCNLFGSMHREARLQFLGDDRADLFLDAYEPWEVEEILCMNSFADAKYEAVFDKVKLDLHPDNPRFDSVRTGPYTPPGSFYLDDDVENEWHRNGMVSSGLALLSNVLKTQDHYTLVKTISDNIVSIGDSWIAEAVDISLHERRRANRYSDRDRAQDQRDQMPFSGDKEDLPPLAWVTIWQETYSNLYGLGSIPSPLQSWGYVMWDASRLVDSGAMAVLDRQWKDVYEEGDDMDDPRNYM